MNPKFLPLGRKGKVARVVEEAGEVIQAIGKANRFGLRSAHPLGGLNNAALILSEIADLRHAMDEVERELRPIAAVVRQATETYPQYELGSTDRVISTEQLLEMMCDEFNHQSEDEFLDNDGVVETLAGEWRKEGLNWRLYSARTESNE